MQSAYDEYLLADRCAIKQLGALWYRSLLQYFQCYKCFWELYQAAIILIYGQYMMS